MSDLSDQLANQPPYLDDNGQIVEDKPEGEIDPEAAQTETETETPETPTEDKALENAKNPERTKEYIDKLKAERDAAREEARKSLNQPVPGLSFDQQFPQTMTTNQVPPVNLFPNLAPKEVKGMFDALTDDQGYVDTGLLKETLVKADQDRKLALEEAARAKQEVRELRNEFGSFQKNQVAKQVHSKYPELDPDNVDGFNPEYFEFVKNEMVGQLIKSGQQDYMAAADKWYSRFVKDDKSQNKEVKAVQNAQAQINATGNRSGVQKTDSPEVSALRNDVFQGKRGALGDLLQRTGN